MSPSEMANWTLIWAGLSAVATLFAAIANFWLAFLAWRTIKESNETSKRLERELVVLEKQTQIMQAGLGIQKRAEGRQRLERYTESFRVAAKAPTKQE